MRAGLPWCVAIRPALLEGYVGSMLEFADFLEGAGLRMPPLRALATTAAPLTGSARRRLETFFDAPVYDEYRGSEFGWSASRPVIPSRTAATSACISR